MARPKKIVSTEPAVVNTGNRLFRIDYSLVRANNEIEAVTKYMVKVSNATIFTLKYTYNPEYQEDDKYYHWLKPGYEVEYYNAERCSIKTLKLEEILVDSDITEL